MTQFLTAILRTVVPSLWGSFIAWLVLLLPLLAPLQDYLLSQSDVITTAVTSAVTAVVIGAWYALWRWLQPRLPAWLTRAVLGSAKTPIYTGAKAVAPNDGPDHRA